MSNNPRQTQYHFFPFVRGGYIPTNEDPGSGPLTHGKLALETTVTGSPPAETGGPKAEETVTKQLDVYGPGEVTGIDHRQVVRTEPESGTANFPPNYFPAVEFDRPDIPWLFTPAKATASDGRLRPWLCLVTVRDQDGVTLQHGGQGGNRSNPLPVLEIGGPADPGAELPDLSECWAWAHTQLVGNIQTSDSAAIRSTFRGQSNVTLSRLLSPRRLQENESYHACVVPTFEPGVRAGLGKDPYPGDDRIVDPAWDDGESTGQIRLPVYYHWEFSTGPAGDFESLVRRLTPEQHSGLGIRAVDASDPGPTALESAGEETVDLEGALRSVEPSSGSASPDGQPAPPRSYDPDKQRTLRDILNRASALSDPIELQGPEGDTPTLGPPLYGQWPVAEPLVPDSGGQPVWLRELNLDPRFRLPAGFGTRVVRDQQEHLLASAWEQVGSLRQANQILRFGQFGREPSRGIHDDLADLDAPSLLQLTASLHARVNWEDDQSTAATARHRIDESRLPRAVLSPSFRRLTRTGGSIARRFETADATLSVPDAIRGLNDGSLTLGTESPPSGMATLDLTVDDDSLASMLCANARARVASVEERRREWSLTRDEYWDDGQLLQELVERCQEVVRALPSSGARPSRGGGRLQQLVDDLRSECEAICGNEREGWEDSLLGDLRTAIGDESLPEIVRVIVELQDHVAVALELTEELVTAAGEEDDTEVLRETLREDCDQLESRFHLLIVRFGAALLAHHCLGARDSLLAVRDALEQCREAESYEDVTRHVDRIDELCRDVCGEGETVTDVLDADRVLAELNEDIRDGDVDSVRTTLRELRQVLERVRYLISRIRSTASREKWLDAIGPALDDLGEECDEFAAILERLEGRLAEYPVDHVAEQLGPGVCGPPPTEPDPPLDIGAVSGGITAAIDPRSTIPRRISGRLGGVDLTSRADALEQIIESPEFTQPMYEPLRDLSEEYLLPSVGEIPMDSVGVLETNPAFVEAYMVGLSHEMGRELRWHEYPTDLRWTYFRRFWDRRGTVPEPTADELDDINPVHTWRDDVALGDQPSEDGTAVEPSIVLLIRGELLERFPNTTIYAAEAIPEGEGPYAEGEPIPRIPDLPDPSATDPSDQTGSTKYPVFRGTLEPDITFLGFDLTPDEAFGTTTEADDLGWFFVLEEPPGDPRFGLDEPGESPSGECSSLKTWDDLDWGHLSPEGAASYVELASLAGGQGAGSSDLVGKKIGDVVWGKNSAHMASVTWQRPFRKAVHADDMLPTNPAGGQ
ncbi:hypothetical protein [Halobellus litoreus]|uniref:Uncharacterized protein n=1 Tax=Halobellus litoreus TaxID=755310 RepID=A0ABD6E1S3_9EURY|nr:hypothetical protein [Halobellus litoreus]